MSAAIVTGKGQIFFVLFFLGLLLSLRKSSLKLLYSPKFSTSFRHFALFGFILTHKYGHFNTIRYFLLNCLDFFRDIYYNNYRKRYTCEV